jgi:hypothetical protein
MRGALEYTGSAERGRGLRSEDDGEGEGGGDEGGDEDDIDQSSGRAIELYDASLPNVCGHEQSFRATVRRARGLQVRCQLKFKFVLQGCIPYRTPYRILSSRSEGGVVQTARVTSARLQTSNGRREIRPSGPIG